MQPIQIAADNSPLTIVMDGEESIEIVESAVTVNITMNVYFVPFYFVATSGQTTFTLSTTPKTNGMIMLARNGTWQSQIKGDFSIAGKVITTDTPMDAGDELAGIYESL
jgi:hypothetical protein